MLTVERIASFDEWLALEVEWEDLLSRAQRDEIFLSHRWITNWYRHFGEGKSLYVLVVKEESKWIGALPLVLMLEYWHGVSVRTLRFPINLESGNLRCDFILSLRSEEAVSALIQYLTSKADEWNRWDLSGLPVGSQAFPFLHMEISRSPWTGTFWQFKAKLSHLLISNSWESYVKSRSYSFRKHLRLSENRMERLGTVTLQIARGPEEISKGIEELFELDSRSSKATRPGVIHLEGAVRDFYRGLADSFGKSGDCRIDTLRINGISVAALFSLYSHGVLFLLYTCYEPVSSWVSPGRVLFGKVLQDAWVQGIRKVDFNGMTQFVQTWTDQAQTTLAYTAYSTAVRSRLVYFWERTLSPAIHRAARKASPISFTPFLSQYVRETGASTHLPASLQHPSCLYYENGRTALECSLVALSLQAGDEVLFPAYHCGSEFDVLVAQGLKLRYYPNGPDLVVSVEDLKNVWTAQTKAVYVIHYLGWPQDLAPIAAWCRERNLILIEDCAQALYGSVPDRPIGQEGDLAIFSLHKFLPLQDGGAAVFNRIPAGQPKRGVPLGWRGHVGVSLQRAAQGFHNNRGWSGVVGEMGCHVLSAITRRLGLAPETRSRAMSETSCRMLHNIDHKRVMEERRANYQEILGWFNKVPGVRPFYPVLGEGVVPLLFPLLADNPPVFLAAMERANIEAGMLWSSVHPAFPLDEFPEVAYLKSHLIVVPVHQGLTQVDLGRMKSVVERYVREQSPPEVLDQQMQIADTDKNLKEAVR